VESLSEHGNVCSGCVRAGKCVANGATVTGILGKIRFL
jgi:hypothetical protein